MGGEQQALSWKSTALIPPDHAHTTKDFGI